MWIIYLESITEFVDTLANYTTLEVYGRKEKGVK
jgi:hypothetical protein